MDPGIIAECVAIVIALTIYNCKTFGDREIPEEEIGVMWANAIRELEDIAEEYPEIEDPELINALSNTSRQYIRQRIGALIYSIRNWRWNQEQGRKWKEILGDLGFWDNEE